MAERTRLANGAASRTPGRRPTGEPATRAGLLGAGADAPGVNIVAKGILLFAKTTPRPQSRIRSRNGASTLRWTRGEDGCLTTHADEDRFAEERRENMPVHFVR